jgi:hypothetical protein
MTIGVEEERMIGLLRRKNPLNDREAGKEEWIQRQIMTIEGDTYDLP